MIPKTSIWSGSAGLLHSLDSQYLARPCVAKGNMVALVEAMSTRLSASLKGPLISQYHKCQWVPSLLVTAHNMKHDIHACMTSVQLLVN